MLGIQRCWHAYLRVKGTAHCRCLSGYPRWYAVPARLPCSAFSRVRPGPIACDRRRALPAGPCHASLPRAAAPGRSPRHARSREARAPGVTDTASFKCPATQAASAGRAVCRNAPFLGSMQHQDMTAVACCMLACLATAELLHKEAHAVQPCMGLRPDNAAGG